MATCCDGCVACEVDSRPMDPAWWAERQAAEKAGREAAERLLASVPVYVPGPLALAALEPPVTPRERGRARRAAIAPDAGRDTLGGLGMVFNDRRHSHGGHRR